MYQTYKDRVAFLFVYIKEAHPSGGWQMDINMEENVVFTDPTSLNERRGVATKCRATLRLTMPTVVDDVDNRVDDAYAGWPERMYVIDTAGRIAHAGRRGPWGFKPQEVEQWLKSNVR
jgi:hypothetical protein